jgi:hypothetical protein
MAQASQNEDMLSVGNKPLKAKRVCRTASRSLAPHIVTDNIPPDIQVELARAHEAYLRTQTTGTISHEEVIRRLKAQR